MTDANTEDHNALRIPIRVRVIGIVFVLMGAASVADVVAVVYLRQTLPFDLGVLALPIGIGLLRRSNLARHLAILFCALSAGAMVLFIPFLVASQIVPGADEISLPELLLGVILYLVSFGLVVICWRVLVRPKIVELFQKKVAAPPGHGRFQFGISAILVFMTAAAVIFVRFRSDEFTYHRRSVATRSLSSAPGVAMITYGVREHRSDKSLGILDFVVIQRASSVDAFSSMLRSHSSSDEGTISVLHFSDGRTVELPTDTQLFQIDDGVLHTSESKVTIAQLHAYLNSNPADPNIEDLIATPIPVESDVP